MSQIKRLVIKSGIVNHDTMKRNNMKKYTIAEVKKFKRDKDGVLYLPPGDYTLITSFGEQCSFGAGCSFGEGSSFGEGCSFDGRCSFGKWCSFGEEYSFDGGCKYCNFLFKNLITLNGLHQYSIRIYRNDKKYLLSIGCNNFKTLAKAVTYWKKHDYYCKQTHEIMKKILS